MVDTSLFQPKEPFRTVFLGIIKHLLDLTSSNIQLIAPVQNNIGLSLASPSITLFGRNELDVGDSVSSNKCLLLTSNYYDYDMYSFKREMSAPKT